MLCLTLGILLFQTAVQAQEATKKEDIIVAAHYAPWFAGEEGGWRFRLGEKVLRTPYTPLLGDYDNRDPKILSQHIKWANRYGVNTFMIEWCGMPRGDFFASTDYIVSLFPENPDFANINFYFVYSFASGLRREGEENFSAVDFDDKNVVNKLIKDIEFAASNYFPLPNHLKIDGKPVIYLWAVNLATGNLKKAIAKLRKTILRKYNLELFLIADEVGWSTVPDLSRTTLFDAVMPYIMIKFEGQPPKNYSLKSSLKEIIPQQQYWSNVCDDLMIDYIPGIFPGFNGKGSPFCYDDNYKRSTPVVSRSRSGFSNFILNAKGLIDTDVNMLYITSWSEWNEGTNIEPSNEFGYAYLKVLNKALRKKSKTKPAKDLIRFNFKKYFDPEGADSRLLSVAFDYVKFLNSSQEVITRIDLGTNEARKYLGFGWFANEYKWGKTTRDFVWAGMKRKYATIHLNVPSKAKYMKVRFLHGKPQAVTVYLNSVELTSFKATNPWNWETQIIELKKSSTQ